MESPYTIILLSSLLLFFLRTLIITLHELGHAIPAILFTKQKVTIFIGSYGKPEKSFNFKIGLLEMWFSYEKIFWRNGTYVVDGKTSKNKQLIYVLCGPLCSFIIALALYYCFIPEVEFSNTYIYIFWIKVFLGLSILDLIINLVPKSKPTILSNEEIIYNDGYQIKRIFMHKQINSKYIKAMNLANAGNFRKAIPLFDYLLNKTATDDAIYRLNIVANKQIKNYERAKILSDEFMTKFEVNSDDYTTAGIIYGSLGLKQEALEYYDKALELDNNNVKALNNKGYTLLFILRYKEAIPYFDRSIEISESAFAYTNRGFSKIRLGESDEGLVDIQKAMKLKENYSYNYRNLGIYHLYVVGEYDKALKLFLKAKELDPETLMIEELIMKAQSAL